MRLVRMPPFVVVSVLLSLLLAAGSIGSVASASTRHGTLATPTATPATLTPAQINNMLAATSGPATIGTIKLGPPVIDQPGPCLQPSTLPATLDRTELSNAELLQYGLPPKPTKPSAIPAWAQAVRAAKHRYCSERARLGATAATSPWWAGNVVIGGGYEQAWANWNVPCLAGTSPIGDSAAWEGLGSGAAGNPLVQAGTEQNDLSNGPPPWDVYYVWTENYNYQPQQWQFSIGCGDNIYATSWSPNCSFVQDNRTGENTGDVCAGPSADTYQAEWIAEAPQVNNIGQPLANFQHVNFTNTNDSAPGDADTQPHYAYWMYSNGVYCAYPGAWNNDAFQVTWENSYC